VKDQPAAADRLARRFEHFVRVIVSRVLGPELSSDWDDASQDAWIRVFKGIAAWSEQVPLCQYLSVIVVHSAIDYERQVLRRKLRSAEYLPELHDGTRSAPDPSTLASLRETEARLKAEVGAFAKGVRDVWDLHFAGNSTRAIADSLGISVRTAQWRLAKILKRLEDCLRRAEESDEPESTAKTRCASAAKGRRY
jgi:RNA polymerase sigma factor (sigma-70 family)